MGNTIGSSKASSSKQEYANMNAETLVKNAISKNPIVIFSKSYCPYCFSAKSDIAAANKVIKDAVEPKVYELDRMGTLGSEVQNYLHESTGRRTVPNVFINGKTVGGGDDVGRLASSGILKQMITQAIDQTKSNNNQQQDENKFDLDKIIQSNPIVVFSKSYCPFCHQAKHVLNQVIASKFEDDDSKSPTVYELDNMEDGAKIQNLLFEKTNQRTVPNIFINGKHIGGCDDLMSKVDSLPSLVEEAYKNAQNTEQKEEQQQQENKTVEQPENIKSITLGAGCFWGVQLAFQRVEGVVDTEVGYSNGRVGNINYDSICTGLTGATEVVKVTYDEDKVPLKQLLHVWNSRHDPTSLNKQGNDVGTQYRSAIYYTDDDQKSVVDEFVEELRGKLDGEIVTDIAKIDKYSKGEDYHQQYLEKRGQSAAKGDTSRIRCYG